MFEENVPQEEVEVTEDLEDIPEPEEQKPEVKEDPYAKLSHEEAIERLKKAETTLIKHKKVTKPNPTPQPKTDEVPEWGKKILVAEEKRTFGYQRNLSPETVDAVFQFTGGRPPSDEDMEHEAVKAIVKAFEAKRRVSANTPKGGTPPTYKGKTYSETVIDPTASRADKQAAFDAARKKHGLS